MQEGYIEGIVSTKIHCGKGYSMNDVNQAIREGVDGNASYIYF